MLTVISQEERAYAQAAIDAGYVSQSQVDTLLVERSWLAANGVNATLQSLLRKVAIDGFQHEQLIQRLEAPAVPRRLGDYELGPAAGRTLRGIVYPARRVGDRRRVAVRVLPRIIAQKPGFAPRFLERVEAFTWAGRHPHLIPVLGAGIQDGLLYYAQGDWLDSTPLPALLAARRQLSERQALEIGLQIAEALQHLHGLSLVHRGVALGTIVLAADGRARLNDLGLADNALVGVGGARAAYLAPEQVRGEPADEQTDIYSLGMVLWTLLIGRPPFNGTAREVMRAQLTRQVPGVGRSRPRMLDLTAQLIDRMLEKEREPRALSTRVLVSELRQAHAAAQAASQARGARTRPLESVCRQLAGQQQQARA